MKIEVPEAVANQGDAAISDYCDVYYAGWIDYRSFDTPSEVGRNRWPAAYDAGYMAAVVASMNWKHESPRPRRIRKQV